jgi:hypothetical protein
MDVCCSHDGHRHLAVIVGVKEVVAPPVEEVGTRGAKGKLGHSH